MELFEKGRKSFIAITLIFLVMKILFAISDLSIAAYSGGEFTFRLVLVFDIIIFIFTALMLLFIYKGYGWAKWLLVIFLIIGGALYLISYIKIEQLILLLKGVCYLALGIGFIVSRSMKEFVKMQKEKAISEIQLDNTETKLIEKRQIKFTRLSILSFCLSIIPYLIMVIYLVIVTRGNANNIFIPYLNMIIAFFAAILSIIDLVLKDRKRLLSILAIVFSSIYFLVILSVFFIAAIIFLS